MRATSRLSVLHSHERRAAAGQRVSPLPRASVRQGHGRGERLPASGSAPRPSRIHRARYALQTRPRIELLYLSSSSANVFWRCHGRLPAMAAAIVSGGQVSASGLSSPASMVTTTVSGQGQASTTEANVQRYCNTLKPLITNAAHLPSGLAHARIKRPQTSTVRERMVWMETCPGCAVPVAAAGSLFLQHLRLCCPDVLERLLAEPHNARSMLLRPHVPPPPSPAAHTRSSSGI
jgi:hypothetical protein